jgi:hypothetical protein
MSRRTSASPLCPGPSSRVTVSEVRLSISKPSKSDRSISSVNIGGTAGGPPLVRPRVRCSGRKPSKRTSPPGTSACITAWCMPGRRGGGTCTKVSTTASKGAQSAVAWGKSPTRMSIVTPSSAARALDLAAPLTLASTVVTSKPCLASQTPFRPSPSPTTRTRAPGVSSWGACSATKALGWVP